MTQGGITLILSTDHPWAIWKDNSLYSWIIHLKYIVVAILDCRWDKQFKDDIIWTFSTNPVLICQSDNSEHEPILDYWISGSFCLPLAISLWLKCGYESIFRLQQKWKCWLTTHNLHFTNVWKNNPKAKSFQSTCMCSSKKKDFFTILTCIQHPYQDAEAVQNKKIKSHPFYLTIRLLGHHFWKGELQNWPSIPSS